MNRRPIYSKSGKPRSAGALRFVAPDGVGPAITHVHDEAEGPSFRQRAGLLRQRLYGRHQGKILVVISTAVTLMVVGGFELLRAPSQNLTQRQLNAAVNFAIDERPRPPSIAASAYARIIPSVVRVNGYNPEDPQPADDGSAEVELPAENGLKEDFHEDYTAGAPAW